MINLKNYYNTDTNQLTCSNEVIEQAFKNENDNIINYISNVNEKEKEFINSFSLLFSNELNARRYNGGAFEIKKTLNEFISNPYLANKDILKKILELIVNGNNSELLKEVMILNETTFGKKDFISLKLNNLSKKINSYVLASQPTNGGFNYEDKTIILHLKAISNSDLAKSSSIDTTLNTTYAHEVFHAYHYAKLLDNKQKWNTGKKEFYIVVESLAKAFELLYCRDILKDERYINYSLDTLNNCDINDWPYTGAVKIYQTNSFEKILLESIRDYNTAYKSIINL